jgi:hypothetical protein
MVADAQRPAAGAEAAHARFRAALDEIRATGTKGAAVQAFLDGLPRAGGLYVVEGDMLMSETEVVQTYLTRLVAQGNLQPGPELKINLLPSGTVDRYDARHRLLPYAIDRRTFNNQSQFDSVVTYMASATSAWQRACPACGLSFRHISTQDAAPSPRSLNFIVRNFDARGEYIAASFFPHDAPDRRFLNIDPSYYSTTFDKIGVLRHELGHVLGYRHEHIAGIPGCYREDSGWRPLTPYDSRSVMHYFCGGGGTMTLELTATDISGHRLAYKLR